jgi:methionyl-tRNA formyltransferase
MRVVFFGTPSIATPPLQALLDSAHQVVAVVTQPDRAKGRSGAPVAPPVKQLAEQHSIPALQPETPKQPEFAAQLASFTPDVCAVVAYGHLLPPAVLAVPPKGTVNVHFSLLPRYRGAAPVQRAIMNGDTQTGVCVFVLEPTLDTGPMILRVPVPIEPDDTTGSLMERLAPVGATALVAALDEIEAGTAAPVEQDDTHASPAPKIKPEEAQIDWTRPAPEIRNAIRGLNPNPGAFTWFRSKRVKIWSAALAPGGGSPGEVLPEAEPVTVAAGTGALRILELQPEGKRRMSPEEFLRGARLQQGERFGGNQTDR